MDKLATACMLDAASQDLKKFESGYDANGFPPEKTAWIFKTPLP